MNSAGRRIVYVLVTALCATGMSVAQQPAELDYSEHYANGITFAAFLDKAESRRDQWHANYNDAAVTADMVTRIRALPGRRRLLVVAEDWCGDSVNTIPYLARLIDAAPERLQLRLIDSKAGRALLEAHRTPDGRAATPTVIVLDEDGRVLGAWTERPAALRAWVAEQKAAAGNARPSRALHDRTMKWYADDAGQSTVADIAEILAR
jgi:hypothetical protein